MTDARESELIPEEQKRTSLSQMMKWGGGAAVPVGLISLAAHGGWASLAVAAGAAFVASRHGQQGLEYIHDHLELPGAIDRKLTEQKQQRRQGRSILDRALGRFPEDYAQDEPTTETESLTPGDESAVFVSALTQLEAPGVPRITVEQAIAHTERNSYEVYIGRSMTRPNNPAVKIGFYKRHLKLIGASQHGKSSMAAALIDAITRSHDPDLVQIAILDLEDKTGRLFEGLPHITRIRKNGEFIRLHARSYEQVLEYLGHVSALIDFRYSLPSDELERQPLLIVYLEEFVDLKDYFKQRVNAVERDEQEQAKQDYARLVYYIKKVSARGLKVHVQLLMCAQVDYRDDDLQAALINVTSGMSFCVRTSAAQAAGFYQSELLTRNAKEDKIGQAVTEMPDCKDLILAPEYDLTARLKSLTRKTSGYGEAPHLSVVSSYRGSSQEVPYMADDEPIEQAEDVPGNFRPREDDLMLSEVQEQVFLAYYRNCGNIGESLAQIKNERGQGLGARYHRHASYLLEMHGLKKRRA